MRTTRAAIFAAVALLAAGTPRAAADPVAVPGGEVPSELAALGELSRARAIAIAPDGARVAAAFPAGKGDEQSRVAVAGLAEGWVLDGKGARPPLVPVRTASWPS